MANNYLFLVAVGIVILTICDQVYAKEKTTDYAYGTLKVNSAASASDINPIQVCMSYGVDYYSISSEITYRMKNYSSVDLCLQNLTNNTLISDHPNTLFLLTASSNCSENVTDNLPFIQQSGKGLILISSSLVWVNQSYGLEVFALISPKSAQSLWNFNTTDELYVRMYGTGFDGSTVVLGTLAVLCVIIGSFIGPYGTTPGGDSNESRTLQDSSETGQGRMSDVTINIITVFALVVFITIALLLLYYFYKYLVYFFIVIFCIASTRATYCLLTASLTGILRHFKLENTIPKIRSVGLHEILAAGICVSITIVWVVFRFSSFSWILQDFLGVCFCIHIIQTLRLPNLKICTALLSMLFFYDIFFVFVTPLFMENGQSIMVSVATGSGSNSSEKIPLLLRVPRLQNAACPVQYSLLGFGDIIIPGLLVCFAHSFDLLTGARFRPYFLSTSIGYTVGLFGAFVALYLMSTGQPALLYIVPALLIAIFSVGACRKETKHLWSGSQKSAISDTDAEA